MAALLLATWGIFLSTTVKTQDWNRKILQGDEDKTTKGSARKKLIELR